MKLENGRGERIRTSDPLLPKQVRYQAALRPDNFVSGRYEVSVHGIRQSGGLACSSLDRLA